MPLPAASSSSALARCGLLQSHFNQRLEDAAAASSSREEAARLATKEFWDEQLGHDLWVVPMGDDSVFARCCGERSAL